MSLRPADHSSRGVLPSVACQMNVIVKPREGKAWSGIGRKRHRKSNRRLPDCSDHSG